MTRLFHGLAALLFVVIGSAGCTEEPASESVGYVSIPLTAPGAGGATYRLPPGTALFLSGGSFFGAFSLDDEAPAKTVKVPPGDYSVGLFGGTGDGTVFLLTRENADGTFETVPGTLDLTPTITVVEDQTTPLVIRFHVVGAFPITFSLGSVEVSVEVDETAASSFDIELAAPALTVTSVNVGDAAPAELPPRLPAVGGTGDSYVATMHTVGSWIIRGPGTVCIRVAASAEASGNQGFTDLVIEAPPLGFEELCIVQVEPHFARLIMFFSNDSAARTPLLSDLGDRFLTSHGILADIDANLFDEATLHINALSGVRPANMIVSGAIFGTPDGGTTFDSWYQLNEEGGGTIALTPR